MSARKNPGARPDTGFALLIVLWTLAFLALLVTTITATGRGEARIADGVRNSAAAGALAEAAVQEAMFHLLDRSPAHWTADGSTRAIRIPPGAAEVRITNEDGKVDLNAATIPLLTQLLTGLGLDRGTAASLGAAIMDWRTVGVAPQINGAKAPQYAAARLSYGPPNENYRNITELSMVRGMTPALLEALLPHVTVYGLADINLADADPVVAQAVTALAAAPGAQGPQLSGMAVSQTIYATVEVVAVVRGARAVRRAIVAIQANDPAAPYRIVGWGDAAG